MPKFRDMRHRVDFAYNMLNTDIYYEGDYRYTIEDHNQQELFEMIDEDDLDQVLENIWRRCSLVGIS